jgi:hypothetical protein
MAKAEHRQQLYDHMREIMANDRARHNILPLSKFGLMQITRQRVRPALDITVAETCPSCFGRGEVQPSLLFTDTLYEKLEYIVRDLGKRDFTLFLHPFVEAYVKKGLFFNLYRTWRRKLGGRFKIIADQSLAYLQYRVVDAEGCELQLQAEKDLNQSSVTKTEQKARNRAGNDDETTRGSQRKEQPKGNAPAARKQQPQQKQDNDDKPSRQEKAQPDTKAAKKPATPATQAPQAPKQNKQQEATLLLPAHEESTAPKTTSVQAIPQHDSIEDNPATTATDNLPENTSAEAEIATENGTAPGAPAKLTKSQRRRRARKRSREAAKAALAESAETVEAEDAPMQEQPAD